MTAAFSDKLQLPCLRSQCISVSTFGTGSVTKLNSSIVRSSLVAKDGTCLPVETLVVPVITNPKRRYVLPDSDLPLLESIGMDKLADTICSTPESVTIDILIGSDHLWQFMKGAVSRLPSGLQLLPTKFGLIVTGRFGVTHDNEHHDLCLSTIPVLSAISDIDQHQPNLENLWHLETVGISSVGAANDEDKVVKKRFLDTVKFSHGRYEVTWPWRDPEDLPDNFGLAVGRLKSLGRRFQSDQKLF